MKKQKASPHIIDIIEICELRADCNLPCKDCIYREEEGCNQFKRRFNCMPKHYIYDEYLPEDPKAKKED